IWQTPEQQSPGSSFPSSQVSPLSLCTTPSPQYSSVWQALPGVGQVQPCSSLPLPQAAVWVAVHAVPAAPHEKPCSTSQTEEQPSPLLVLPSSQDSSPCLIPSPQICVSVKTQAAFCTGHTYPGSSWQTPEQPSPGTELPSSHCSPGSTAPSPQIAMVASVHAAPTHPPSLEIVVPESGTGGVPNCCDPLSSPVPGFPVDASSPDGGWVAPLPADPHPEISTIATEAMSPRMNVLDAPMSMKSS